jgi:hypothetical protein
VSKQRVREILRDKRTVKSDSPRLLQAFLPYQEIHSRICLMDINVS